MVQPLTRRELEILQLLSAGLSDKDIAHRLVVGLNTIKWYNRQIFNKLAVSNRQQAVEIGSSMGLLGAQAEKNPVDKHNLPAQLTPFIGRISELEELNQLLLDPLTRLITIHAPGGMGKTRLAVESALQAAPQFADGVYFVPLAPLTEPTQLISAIADTIGLQVIVKERSPLEQLCRTLRNKHMLLLLDNVEHMLTDVLLLNSLLVAAPRLKLLATSRERLDLQGETVYSLGGMAFPRMESEEYIFDYSAVQLFIACAQRTSARFIPNSFNEVARICRSVNGMPLAIELAAAWVGTLGVLEIAVEIERNLDFLSTTMQNIPERLRSVRAVFESTWERLSEVERRVFCRLSIFRDGFTREAALAVAEAGATTLAELVNKALVWRNSARNRYELHELLRQYGEEQLRLSDADYQATMEKYSQWYADFCQRVGEMLKGPELKAGLDAIEEEFNSILIGWHWAASHLQDDFLWRYVFALYYFGWLRYRTRDIVPEYQLAIDGLLAHSGEQQRELLHVTLLGLQTWMKDAMSGSRNTSVLMQQCVSLFDRLQISEVPPVTIIAFSWIGWWLISNHSFTDGIRFCDTSITLGQQRGFRFELGQACFNYGYAFANAGKSGDGEPYIEQAHQIAHELQQPHFLGATFMLEANKSFEIRDYRAAVASFKVAIEKLQEVGDWMNAAAQYSRYIECLFSLQEYEGAFATLQQALLLDNRLGNSNHIDIILVQFTKLLAATGNQVHAVEVGSFYSRLSHRESIAYLDQLIEQVVPLLAELERELPPDVFAAARKRGEQTPLGAIMKDILDGGVL